MSDTAILAVLRDLAETSPYAGLQSSLDLAQRLVNTVRAHTPATVVEDHAWRVEQARQNPKVRAALDNGMPILAIKELRLAINCGLKEAKEAIDVLRFG